MAIDPKWIINLKGRDYPQWGGVLDAAQREGLKSLTTEVLQFPAEANQFTAVVRATAVFQDERTFSDIGDASPRNVAKHLVEAILRMASTRAKGRCLRDALNVGETMWEELPEDERAPQTAGNGRAAAAPQAKQPARAVPPRSQPSAQRPAPSAAAEPQTGYFTDDKGKIWEIAQLKEAARTCLRRAEALKIPHAPLDVMTAEPKALYDFGREMGPLIRAREAELKAERAAAKG